MLRLLILALVLLSSRQTLAARPNFILLYTDDQQVGAAGFMQRGTNIHTPALDAFAARGVQFTDAHVVYALCGPSRAAVMSGKYGSRNGMIDFDTRMKPQPTVASWLKDAGYATAVVGKWHVNPSPRQLGFDRWTTFKGNGAYYGRTLNHNGRSVRADKLVDEHCVDVSIELLKEAAEGQQPFFLFHNTQLPHMDGDRTWPARPESLALYDVAQMPLPATWNDDLAGKPPYLPHVRNRTVAWEEYGYQDPDRIRRHAREYYAVTSEMDAAVGRLFAALDRAGLDETTYVFVMADNGWMIGEHGMTSKILAYEPSTHVPFFVVGPGIEPGVRTELVLNIDIAPTILDLAGLEVPKRVQGHSLVPLLRRAAADSASSENSAGENDDDASIAAGWRSAFVYEGIGHYADIRPHLAAITSEWKLIQTFDSPACDRVAFEELYHRVRDPDEIQNLAGAPEHAGILRTLRTAINEHITGWAE